MRILQSVVTLFAAATLQAATHEATVSFVGSVNSLLSREMRKWYNADKQRQVHYDI